MPTCAIEHADPSAIPRFLCRTCNPTLGRSHGPYLVSTILDDKSPQERYRELHPLTEHDQLVVQRLLEREAAGKIVPANTIVDTPAYEKPAKPAKLAKPAKRGGGKPGIIATLCKAMQEKGGATQEEMLKRLVETFPERNVDGMRSTIKIQSKSKATSSREIKGRGKVFFMKVVQAT